MLSGRIIKSFFCFSIPGPRNDLLGCNVPELECIEMHIPFSSKKFPQLSVSKTFGFSRNRDSNCPLLGVPELASSSSHEGPGRSPSPQRLFSLPVSLPRDLLPKRTLESLGVVTLTSRATSTDSLSSPVLASIATQTHASFSKEVSPYRLVNSLHPCREEAWPQALIKKGFNSHASDLIVSRQSQY